MLLYIPYVQKGMSSKLQRKWKWPYYIVECGDNHTYSLRNAETHPLQKTLVHVNRLKPYNERHKSHELTDNKDNEKEPAETERPTTSQTDSTVSEDTISRQPDHSQSGDSQNTIERVLCSKRHRGKMWYKVKWWNVKKREWVGESVIPRDMQRDYFVKYTMAGRAKKKKRLKQTA